MTDRITIEIVGKDNASKVFEKVVDAAEEFRPAIDGATSSALKFKPAAEEAVDAVRPLDKELDETAKSAKEAGTEIQKSAESLDQYKDAADKTKQGLGLLGAAFALYANQSRDHELTIQALNRIYGDAADSYVAFANQIQSTSIFSNDEALAAARIMGTLRENYGLTDEAIQQLIQTSADLATMHGFTLSDAAMRVQSAIRGEAESIEALGASMQQSAIDAEGLTLTMSNAEAAAFRFDALMGQTTSSVGAAAEAANDTSGEVQQLANRTQDAALRFVDFTGPVGDAAGALSSFGIEAGLALGGIGQLARGIKGFGAAAGGTTVFSSLSTIIGGAGGTGGLAAAVSAAGAAALIAAPAVFTLGGAIAYLAITQGDLEEAIGDQTNALIKWADSSGRAGESYNDLIFFAQDFRDLLTQIQLIDPWTGVLQAPTTLNTLFDELMQLSPESIRLVESALNDLGYSLGNLDQWVNDSEAMSEIAQVVLNAWAAQIDTAAELSTAVDQTNQRWEAAEQAMNQAAVASYAFTEATRTQQQAQQDLLETNRSGYFQQQEQNRILDMVHAAYLDGASAIEINAAALNGLDLSVNQVAKSYADLFPEIEQTTRATMELDSTWTQVSGTMKDDVAVSIADVNAEFDAAVAKASGLTDAMLELQRIGGSSINLAIGTSGAAGALQSGFGAIVGGTNAMGQLADQTWQWSNSLTEGVTGQSKLDELLLDGAISQKTYGEALDANHRIMKANESVQEDVLRIQAKQLPVMADLAEAHARYIDELADEDVATQTAALGFMDQSKAAQAMGVAQLVAAASSKEMQASTAVMIEEMAKGDPVLAAMLEKMGLISVGADGTITVNFDDAASADDILSTLNETLGELNDLLANIFLVDVQVNDGASSTLTAISNQLANLDGKTATVYINTLGGNSVGFTEARNGGMVGYANGGMVMAELGEAGAELVRLANGGVAMAPTRGLYMIERGSNVLPAEATKAELQARRRSGGGNTYIYSGQVSQRVVFEESSYARRRAGMAGRHR